MFTRILSFISSSRRDILILFTALFNRNTPKMIKTITIMALIYLISPIDFLPDMIPGLGLLDDAVVVPGVLYTMLQMLPASVRAKSEAQADYLGPKALAFSYLRNFSHSMDYICFCSDYNFIFN